MEFSRVLLDFVKICFKIFKSLPFVATSYKKAVNIRFFYLCNVYAQFLINVKVSTALQPLIIYH